MLQNKGRVYYENNYYNNFNNGGMRYDNSYTNIISEMEKSEQDITISEEYFKEVGDYKMEQPEVVTMITSVIAGLYAVVKTIINLIKKFKN